MSFFNPTDLSLTQKALNGNKRAWGKLVIRHEQAVYNVCYRLLLNREDALDCMQETFITVYRNLPNYRGDGKLISWILRIANNRCIDHIRKKRMLDDIEQHEYHLETGDNIEADLISHRANQSLLKLLKKLSFEQRHVVELKFFHQMTFKEIAQLTGTSENTVKTRLYSALSHLKHAQELRHAL